jgi:hypothetical protein
MQMRVLGKNGLGRGKKKHCSLMERMAVCQLGVVSGPCATWRSVETGSQPGFAHQQRRNVPTKYYLTPEAEGGLPPAVMYK